MTLQPAQSKGTYLCFVPVFNQKLSFCLIEEQEMESSLVTRQNSDNESQFIFLLGIFICSPCICVGSLWVLQLPNMHARQIGNSKFSVDVCENVTRRMFFFVFFFFKHIFIDILN